jgi:hypothetical protein
METIKGIIFPPKEPKCKSPLRSKPDEAPFPRDSVLPAAIVDISSVPAVARVADSTNCSQKPQPTQHKRLPLNRQLQADPYQTAYNYLVTFYPRWFTWEQGSGGACNVLVGPERVSPIYQAVVAINVDTLYASTFIGAADEPAIVSIPKTDDIFSVLHLDQYGALVPNGMSGTTTAGVYGIVGPNWNGTLPQGITRVDVPYNFTELLFRADKYSPQDQDMMQEAEASRRGVLAQGLSSYLQHPGGGATVIKPEREGFDFPFKTFADGLISLDPIVFLRQLQDAVNSPTTQPLSQDEQKLADTFDALFTDPSQHPKLAAGAQAGHQALVNNYLSHQIIATSTWITFNDIANWNLSSFQGYLNRASITEYLQYGNNHDAAAYFHTFLDTNRQPLDGSLHSYTLSFAKGQQPEAKRFWSLTAYTPQGIELVPNQENKYVVASYTPGLFTDPQDGSVTILMSTSLPKDFPEPNWLPIPYGSFNVMLRDYGPEGNVANGTYVPPQVVPQ